MDALYTTVWVSSLTPIAFMLLAFIQASFSRDSVDRIWPRMVNLSWLALAAAVIHLLVLCVGNLLSNEVDLKRSLLSGWLAPSVFGAVVALLVQFLGTLIAVFSTRYLQGEAKQQTYIRGLAGVLVCVQLLLLADHWIVLILAWALVGISLQPLLCFYSDRPFARLAAHKKRLADRTADLMLILAALTAWIEVGSGSFSDLHAHVEQVKLSFSLHLSAIFLVLAIILRTALLPVHGWLIQVMEAPTPVSALLHAGVINLGGFVLISFAPLLDKAFIASGILVVFGLVTAVLAGLVMLTRISIKVRLAWSTLAQMGFMILEAGLGLYTLAALHLIGHSIYKAHAFLAASSMVRHTKLAIMQGRTIPTAWSIIIAPLIAALSVFVLVTITGQVWPVWWTFIMALAWSPLLWIAESNSTYQRSRVTDLINGLGMILVLTVLAILIHKVPLGLNDSPRDALGAMTLTGMVFLYLVLAVLQLSPERLAVWRRSVYAGFYIDEYFTRLTLKIWPTDWGSTAWSGSRHLPLNTDANSQNEATDNFATGDSNA